MPVWSLRAPGFLLGATEAPWLLIKLHSPSWVRACVRVCTGMRAGLQLQVACPPQWGTMQLRALSRVDSECASHRQA